MQLEPHSPLDKDDAKITALLDTRQARSYQLRRRTKYALALAPPELRPNQRSHSPLSRHHRRPPQRRRRSHQPRPGPGPDRRQNKTGLTYYQRPLSLLDPKNAILHEDARSRPAAAGRSRPRHPGEFRARARPRARQPATQLRSRHGPQTRGQGRRKPSPLLKELLSSIPASPIRRLRSASFRPADGPLPRRRPRAREDPLPPCAPKTATPGAFSAASTNEMDQPDKAIPALRRAIELQPDQPSPHINLQSLSSPPPGGLRTEPPQSAKAADFAPWPSAASIANSISTAGPSSSAR